MQLSEQLSDKIWDEVIRWPQFVRDTVGKQLVRSADSIGANIAECHGRHHPNDALNFLYFARGSGEETKYWIRRASHRGLWKNLSGDALLQEVNVLAKQLNAYISVGKGLREKERDKLPKCFWHLAIQLSNNLAISGYGAIQLSNHLAIDLLWTNRAF